MKIINKIPLNYQVEIGSIWNDSQALKNKVFESSRRVVVISDDVVAPLYAGELRQVFESNNQKFELITFQSGEANKTRETKAYIEDQLLAMGCGRDTLLIALGGGVVCDLAGFVAATYCRGVPVVYLPTTLLSMVDAAVGGKTGVNTPLGKNMIGVFKQPDAVIMAVNTLKTLSESDYVDAYAEIIKHGLIADKHYYEFINANIEKIQSQDCDFLIEVISKSCQIKADTVSQDEKECGIRAILNLGHTIGHAIESLSDYKIPHGQAVAIGIIEEGKIAVERNLLSQAELDEMKHLFENVGIDIDNPYNFDELKQSMVLDKKSKAGMPRVVLLKAIGQVYVDNGEYTHELR